LLDEPRERAAASDFDIVGMGANGDDVEAVFSCHFSCSFVTAKTRRELGTVKL
jgi:hypothetical protein